ncbi:hypothetical protein [Natronorubrum sp. FCH18a]|uniref:hypothetical protein n=1 Tax=Natronorubrum sp. FCH18a TaxID=3447018 RepID=UPI003F51A60B
MTRTRSLLAAALVVLGSPVAGVGVAPAAAQEDARESVTLELGDIEGATVCVQQLASDTNQVVIRDAGYEDVTIYLDENRRVELEQTQSDATMILHTDRQNEGLNDLSEVGDCLTTDETNAVVDANSVSVQGLAASGYTIEVGSNGEIPETGGFDAERNNSTEEDTDRTVIDIGEPGESEDERVGNATEPVDETVEETEAAVNETATEEAVDDTLEHTEETVDETANHTEDTVDETGDHLENTTDDVTETLTENPDETDDQLAETTEETVDHTEETVDDTVDHTEEAVDDTTDDLRETTASTLGVLAP